MAIYLLYYYFHYTRYVKYKDSLSSYEYEEGGVFNAVPENSADVPGMQLAAENQYLKLYTNVQTADVAVYDKRDGSITYSTPVDADQDSMANASNLNLLKSQFVVTYYNAGCKVRYLWCAIPMCGKRKGYRTEHQWRYPLHV